MINPIRVKQIFLLTIFYYNFIITFNFLLSTFLIFVFIILKNIDILTKIIHANPSMFPNGVRHLTNIYNCLSNI